MWMEAQHELQLAKDIKHKNKNIILHLQNQERVKGKYRLIDCGEGAQISTEREKSEVLNAL